MFKLIRYLLINRLTKNPLTAARIYQMIYHPEVVNTNQLKSYQVEQPSKIKMEAVQHKKLPFQQPQVLTEKEELQDALNFLLNKPHKTNGDKASIDVLRAAINNM